MKDEPAGGVNEEKRGRWQQQIVRRNTHVRIKASQGQGKSEESVIADFRVMGIYTKTGNKWYPCDKGKQLGCKGMNGRKFRVHVRMIQMDRGMGSYQDIDPVKSSWEKACIFVLCNACDIFGKGQLKLD